MRTVNSLIDELNKISYRYYKNKLERFDILDVRAIQHAAEMLVDQARRIEELEGQVERLNNHAYSMGLATQAVEVKILPEVGDAFTVAIKVDPSRDVDKQVGAWIDEYLTDIACQEYELVEAAPARTQQKDGLESIIADAEGRRSEPLDNGATPSKDTIEME